MCINWHTRRRRKPCQLFSLGDYHRVSCLSNGKPNQWVNRSFSFFLFIWRRIFKDQNTTTMIIYQIREINDREWGKRNISFIQWKWYSNDWINKSCSVLTLSRFEFVWKLIENSLIVDHMHFTREQSEKWTKRCSRNKPDIVDDFRDVFRTLWYL